MAIKYYFLLFFTVSSLLAQDKSWQAQIEKIVGTPGTWIEEEKVFKLSFPRTDVKISVDDWPLPPFMGLTSWLSFISVDDSLLSMGDWVLFEDEVNPVMRTALENGFSVTALHNHFFFDRPKVYFMHIEGRGSAEALGTALKKSFDQIVAIRRKQPTPAQSFKGVPIAVKNSIKKEIVESIFGVKCQENNGMVKAVIGRISQMDGNSLGKEMGINSWAAFGGSPEQAVVDGDIVMEIDELQNVLATLQTANINVVAIHNHMIHEEPRLMFLHFWGTGQIQNLAKGVKLAFSRLGS